MRYCLLLICVLMVGCHRVSYYKPISMEGVEFIAHSRLIGPSSDSVGIWVTVRNTTPHAHEMRVGACMPSARFTTAKGSNNAAIRTWYGINNPCFLTLMISHIPAGYEQTYQAFEIATKDVLGDSLPPARYVVTLFLPVEGTRGIPAGVLDLRAASSVLVP